MVKAPAYGAGDSRFESWCDRLVPFFPLSFPSSAFSTLEKIEIDKTDSVLFSCFSCSRPIVVLSTKTNRTWIIILFFSPIFHDSSYYCWSIPSVFCVFHFWSDSLTKLWTRSFVDMKKKRISPSFLFRTLSSLCFSFSRQDSKRVFGVVVRLECDGPLRQGTAFN